MIPRPERVVQLAAVLALVAFGHLGSAQEPGPRPELAIPRCAAPPLLDGDLGDAGWRQAVALGSFYLWQGGGKTTDGVSARVMCDDHWLYAAYELRLPHPEAISPTAKEHDGSISADDSVEVFLDPGTNGALYFHYMLTSANVRGERRCENQGVSKDTTWNLPWRSATRVTKTGWQAELAIPLFNLAESGSLEKTTVNFCANRVLLTLNYAGVPVAATRECSSWAPVRASFHEPERFGFAKGLGALKPTPPLLVFAGDVKTSSYRADDQGRFSYEVSGVVRRFTKGQGKVRVVLEDRPAAGQGETVQQELVFGDPEALPFSLVVPVKVLTGRTALLTVRDPGTGEVLQDMPLSDLAGLSLMRAYARYSYYTTEADGAIVCEIGLPEQELKRSVLVAQDAAGKALAEMKAVTARTLLPVPLAALPVGAHQIAIELRREGGGTMIRQEVTLVKRAPKPGAEWKVDWRDKNILNNGTPFFPFAIMTSGRTTLAEEAQIKDLADLGFNTVVRFMSAPYENISDLLELAAKYNLYIVDFPQMWRYTAPKDQPPVKKDMTADEQWDWATQNVWLAGAKSLMNHPRLVAWYLADEPQNDLVQAARILRYHQALYALDGYHPTEVLYIPPVPAGDEFSRDCDILGIDPYWVPGGGVGDLGNPNTVGKQTWLARQRGDRDLKLVWVTPCAEQFSGTRMRIFSEKEQRVQTYLSLMHGAKAILYFVYPFKHQVTADAFARLAKEMKVLGPACLAPDVPQTVRYTPVAFDPLNNVFPDVQVALKRNPAGGYVLLAANWRAYPVEVSCKVSLLGEAGTVRELFVEGRAHPVAKGGFTDHLEAMDTRAYAIEGPAELAGPVSIAVDLKALPEKTDPFYTRVGILDNGVPGKKNLLRNSSFEECSIPSMPDYYRDARTPGTRLGFRLGDPRGDCGWGVETKNPYEGKQCLRLDSEKGAHTFFLYDIHPGCAKPESFVFSAWVRSDGAAGTKILFYGPGLGRVSFPLTTEWQRFSQPVTIGAGDYFGLYTISTANSSVWIDAMQFEKGPVLTDYER